MSSQLRKVFISHANPEDNYFANWLAVKLSLMGYEVWCDTGELKGGEDFWSEIETSIRRDSAKFLFVISETSVTKKGVLQELAVADRVANRPNFIIPLRLKAVSPDSMPTELMRLVFIDFASNWSEGLIRLVEKLESDKVFKHDSEQTQQIESWWKNSIAIKSQSLLRRDERYWSNWFPCELPPSIFLHILRQPQLDDLRHKYPAISRGNLLISFASADALEGNVEIIDSIEVKTTDFVENNVYKLSGHDLTINNPNNDIIALANEAFLRCAVEKGLATYEISNGKVSFFQKYLKSGRSCQRVSLERYTLTYVSLIGVTGENNWHYGLQGRFVLYPIPVLTLSHHIVFTNSDKPLNTQEQHKLRRKLGSQWYNKEWRDRLLAAMVLLETSVEHRTLDIEVSPTTNVAVSTEPLFLISPRGYEDPK